MSKHLLRTVLLISSLLVGCSGLPVNLTGKWHVTTNFRAFGFDSNTSEDWVLQQTGSTITGINGKNHVKGTIDGSKVEFQSDAMKIVRPGGEEWTNYSGRVTDANNMKGTVTNSRPEKMNWTAVRLSK